MNNNDILRRLRYVFHYHDHKMLKIFALGGATVTMEELGEWMKREDEEGFVPCRDISLAKFLNGLIVEKRGEREGGLPPAEKRLNNNIIFRKLKIALDLKSEEVLDILQLADFRLSNHELSAFFRKPDHKHYRECHSQILRNFLTGLQMKLRPGEEGEQAR